MSSNQFETIEQNKNLVREFNERIWNEGDFDAISEFVSDDLMTHDPNPEMGRGPESVKELVSMYRTAFPDSHIEINDIVAEEDRVVVRWTATGTHKGDLMGMGIEATNEEVQITGIDINRIENGKIAEVWSEFDMMGTMQQIGVIPEELEN